MPDECKNKVVVVTGAGSGIGRASALMFAREGAKVVVADIVAEGGEQTVQQIKKAGGEAVFIKTDVSKAAEAAAMVDMAVNTYGRLDYGHNNAGMSSPRAPFTEYTLETWEKQLSVNLTGIFLCMKYEIIQMLKNGGGAIVNTASMAGLRGLTLRPGYAASKHGVIGLTKSVAIEYAQSGIRVNAVCPGMTRTPATVRTDEQVAQAQNERMLQVHPAGRWGKPEEIAEAVVWLCSDKASFVTGHSMVVAGGWSAH